MAEASTSGKENSSTKHKEWFTVQPKLDCPHLNDVLAGPQNVGVDTKQPCADCQNVGENWLCLSCSAVYCSRYIQEHMVKHYEKTGHPIAISYADISVWCYNCDSYIDSPALRTVIAVVAKAKFGGT